MSYRVNRALGFQKPGVTNPWVFADYGQPQRRRGYVSPIVFQTQAPGLRTIYLGDDATDQRLLLLDNQERAARMERYTLIGLTLSVLSLGMFAYHMFKQRAVKNRVTANAGPRRARRRPFPYVVIRRRDGRYVVKSGPSRPGWQLWKLSKTVTDARAYAKQMNARRRKR